jgi:hypothetical protein
MNYFTSYSGKQKGARINFRNARISAEGKG